MVFEKFYFFLFFQHFLQQYRRHRIHSFTNTKHTTTTLVAVAVKKKRGRGKSCGLWRVASSALAILLLQDQKKKQQNQKQKVGPALRTAAFCGTYFAARQYNGIQGFISDTRGGSKQIASGLWPSVTPNDRRQKWKLNRRGSVGRRCHRYSACFAVEESHHTGSKVCSFHFFFCSLCREITPPKS